MKTLNTQNKRKSKLMFVFTLFICQLSYAVDFNEIIVENTKAQQNLHSQIKQTVMETQIAAQSFKPQDKFIADTDAAKIIQVKTKKSFLTYEKEKKHSRASASQNEKRLAQEFKDLE
ncbi:MAG: hypothetical protein ACK4VO_07885 [Pseudobdellovibrio sp.]